MCQYSKNGLGGSGHLCLPHALSLVFCRWEAQSQQRFVGKALLAGSGLCSEHTCWGMQVTFMCSLGARIQLFFCSALLLRQPRAGLQAFGLGRCHLPDLPLGCTSLAPFSKHSLSMWGLWASVTDI